MSQSTRYKKLVPHGDQVAFVSGALFSHLHSLFAFGAFGLALIAGCTFSYHKIVQNSYYGYPDEWFPTISATTGDRYPARSIFHLFIALTATPHFAILFLNYALGKYRAPSSKIPSALLVVGLLRTVATGIWVFITSTDHHDLHDVGMIVYLVLGVPYMVMSIRLSNRIGKDTSSQWANSWRKRLFVMELLNYIPLIYFYIQHQVHHVRGAYTTYAFFEWSIMLYDVGFDALSFADLSQFGLNVVDLGEEGQDVPMWSFKPLHAQDDTYSTAASVKTSNGALGSMVGVRLARGLAKVYFGFIFWTLITGLPAIIWYFPLWNMGLSGQEAFLFSNSIPAFILAIPYINRISPAVFHLFSTIGLFAYKYADPAQRLTLTALGTMGTATAWIASFTHANARLERDVLAWFLGLILSLVIKAACLGNNPAWPIMNENTGGWNGTVLALSIISALVLLMTSSDTVDTKKSDDIRMDSDDHVQVERPRWPLVSLAFGSLWFTLHSYFTDSTTILRWTVDGYPNYGLHPVPWGLVTIFAACLGLYLSPRNFSNSAVWHIVGSLSAFGLYYLPLLMGVLSGWILATYIFSFGPWVLRAFAASPTARTFGLGVLWCNILMLAQVWTVAYAFVPAGDVLRERSGAVILMQVAGLLAGASTIMLTDKRNGGPHLEGSSRNARRRDRGFAFKVMLTLLASSTVVYLTRWVHIISNPPVPHIPKQHKAFTAAIWTIHFGLDNFMWVSEERMKWIIDELKIDVIGLLESDLQRIITGNRDLTQSLAERLNMYIDYGPGPHKHTWGCTMLSKFPIIRSSHHLLPSPVGELACAIYATLDVHGQEVDVIVSHNGQEEDFLDRQLQTTELARIMRESKNPFVFLGYVVTRPHEEIYKILYEQGEMADIDPSDWDRWCQYIAYKKLKRVGYARVSHGKITDTEIQLGKFQLLDDPTTTPKGIRSNLASTHPDLRFPSKFNGQGERGHRYHAFDEARYYQ